MEGSIRRKIKIENIRRECEKIKRRKAHRRIKKIIG